MKKITVLDQHERDKANSYFAGFETGVFNTCHSIVELRQKGLGLQKIYKLIEKKYKQECKLRANENNNK